MSFFQPLMQLGSLANTLGQAGLNRVEIWPAASLHSFIEWWECTFTCLLNLDTLHWYFLNSFCFWNVLPTCNQRFMMLKCAVVTQFVTYTSILFLSNDIYLIIVADFWTCSKSDCLISSNSHLYFCKQWALIRILLWHL